MAGLVPCLALLLTASPELPPDARGAAPEPAAASSEDGEALASEPVPEPTPSSEPTAEPTPSPDPTPIPAPVSAAEASRSAPADAEVTPGVLPREGDGDDSREGGDAIVERPSAKMWGMQFTFGGLAPMSIGGLSEQAANRLLVSELGFRRVLSERWTLPFSIGAGVFSHRAEGVDPTSAVDPENDVGLAASFGVQRYFRVWRRIAPYTGGRIALQYLEPDGRANWMVNVGIGPMIGVEYFVADRVSLLLQGEALFNTSIFDGLVQIEFATQIVAGGQTGLVFYF